MSDKTLRVGQVGCHLGGIDMVDNAFIDITLPTSAKRSAIKTEEVIIFDLKSMTPGEIQAAKDLQIRIMHRLYGS